MPKIWKDKQLNHIYLIENHEENNLTSVLVTWNKLHLVIKTELIKDWIKQNW